MMQQLLITIAAVVLVGCGGSRTQESLNKPVQLKDFIVNKKVHFNLKSDLNAKFWCVFDDEGITRHSARPDGKYYVEGLEIKVKDVENVRLVFSNHEISEGDTFKAFSDSQSSALEFSINKIEELKAEAEKTEPPTVKAPDISIHDAARDNNIEVLKQQLEAGIDVNVKDKFGDTPLHKAALNGHKVIAELLIEKGANVNVIIASGHLRGQSALDFASVLKSTELADLLRKHGAKTGEELKAEGK